MDSVNALSVFVQIAEAGSLVGAGRALGISASAVGKSLSRLEHRLGVRLIHRSTRSIALTDDGVVFLERARQILAAIDAIEGEFTQRAAHPRGKLRISLPLVGEPFLTCLAQFKAAYPQVDLEVDFSDRPVDIVEEGFDAAIRSGVLRDSRLTSRTLGDFVMVLAAAPRYLASREPVRSPEDLASHSCIRFRFPSTGKLQAWPIPTNAGEDPIPKSLICNNLEARVSFALAGLGIAYLPDFAIKDGLAEGRLVRVLPQFEEAGQFRILWPSGRQTSPKLRAFVDFASARLFRV